MELIAVIMAADNSKTRFKDAVTLLNYGFGKCQLYRDEAMPQLSPAEVENGVEEQVDLEYAEQFTWLDTTGANLNLIEKSMQLMEPLEAPLKKGDVVGRYTYILEGEEIGGVDIITKADVEEAGMADYLRFAAEAFLL